MSDGSRVGQRPAIALDAAGGDNAPQATVAGAQLAVQTLGVRVLLIGDEVALRAELATQGIQQGDDVRIVHAPDAVAMDEHGAAAARRRRQTSMQLVANAVRDGEAVAGVSAGNSGAFYATSLLTLGRIPGIDRPAIATLFPTATGRCLILDVGANAECKPTHLRDFALMGSLYFGRDQHIAEPRVGLLSNGEEPTKGPPFVQEAHQLIAASAVRFLGNVEGKDVPKGAADVVVCDGYAGNVLLKTAEGVAEALVDDLRKELTHNLMRKVLAAGLRPAFRALRDRLDYAAYGGAPLLGLNGVMIVAHGRSNARAIMNAIRVGRDAAAQGIVTSIGAVGTQ